MFGSTSIKDCKIGPVSIPNTNVQTESVLHSVNPMKHLAYLCQFYQDDFTVIRPLNRTNLECWSNRRKVEEIGVNDLIVTIEVIKDKIILGIDADTDLDVRVLRIGAKLILESDNAQYNIGTISAIHRFTKKIPHPTKSSKRLESKYTVLFQKFVKQSLIAFAKSKFFPTSPLHDDEKLIVEGITYEEILERRALVNGKIATSDGDWFESHAVGFTSLTGFGRLTLPTGEVYEGSFENGILRKGKIIHPEPVLESNESESEETSEDECSLQDGILFKEGTDDEHVQGKKTCSDEETLDGKFVEFNAATQGVTVSDSGMSSEGMSGYDEFTRKEHTWRNGDWLSGYWVKGNFEGEGKLTSQGGVIEKGTWTWSFKGGKLIRGKKTWSNGYWQKGTFEGKGRLIDKNGLVEEGSFRDGILVRGKKIWLDGSWQGGTFEGKGKQMHSNGYIAEGVFKRQTLIRGKKTFPDGYWKEGIFEGAGEQKEKDGSVAIGIFKNGKLIRGKITWRGGHWRKGTFEGEGCQIEKGWVRGGVEGIYENGEFIAPGEFTGIDKSLEIGAAWTKRNEGVEKGIFKKGKLIRGKKTWSYGYGYWEKGTFEGEGVLTDCAGSFYEGFFKNGKLVEGSKIQEFGSMQEGTFEGEGKQTDHKGKISEGFFRDGKLIRGIRTTPSHNTWEKGIFEGEGKRVNQDGFIEKGFFKDGELIRGKSTWPDGVRMYGKRSSEGKLIFGTVSSFCLDPVSFNPQLLDIWEFYPSKLVRCKESKAVNSITKDLKSIEEHIIDYLKGTNRFEESEITEGNALNVLTFTKIIDFLAKKESFLKGSTKRSTYLIRQAVMRKVPNRIDTSQVYTYSLDPADYRSLDYLINPLNWITDRIARQAKLIIDYNILSRFLSERMKRVVVATRGNTGVGKSYWIKRSLIELMLPKYIKDHLDENDHLVHGDGMLNPDHVKAILKKLDSQPLLNGQVYLEGRIVFERYLGMLTRHASEVMGAVIDTRLLTVGEFREVLAFSQSRGAKLEIIDVDASIWCSILSVLNREPFGSDPCVPFEVIKDGYVRARANRGEFIHAARREGVNYSLYRLANDGRYELLLRKREDDDYPTIISQSLFDECLQVPSEGEMNGIAYRVITEDLIQSLEVPRSKEVLQQWIGYTVKDALEMHSNGEKP